MALTKPLSFAEDFPPATAEAWRKLVDGVLKGAPFAKLQGRGYGGLAFEPLYPRDAEASPIAGRAPGTPWTVMQRVDHPDPAAANAQARDDLENGAAGLVLVFEGSVSANGFGLDASPETIARVLDDIALEGVTVDLNLSPQTRSAALMLLDLVRKRGLKPDAVKLRTSFNPIGGFAVAGKSELGWKEMAPGFAAIVSRIAGDGFRGPFVVADGRVIHDSGGSEAQELAFALASAVAYLRALEASGIPLEPARDAIYFRLSADADQFLTMAKFRAIRKLWARIGQACGLAPKPALVTAETAWRMMTRRDPYSNMLRMTIAVAAAALGGADAITVLPHTAALGLPDAFARRVARNTQLLLLEESNLARVADAAAGSGAIEDYTRQLCESAWTLFQGIEQAGGAWAALEAGLIQRMTAEVRAERQTAFARCKDILTGTNAFPNIHEGPAAVLDVAPRPVAPASPSASALPRLRLAEPFDDLRDRSDALLARTGKRPQILLATLGTPADFTARATFAKNFFETGGIEAVIGNASDSAGYALACLCSNDKTYEAEAPAAAAKLKAAGLRHLYLAGRGGEREAALRAAGVGTFIYDGCDAVSVLQAAHDQIEPSERGAA
jgi:methylmalonyl-CoA mutase